MRRDETETDQMPGQDSFLDVITNIVGILILLVLVVGVRTSRSVSHASVVAAKESAGEDKGLREAVSRAMSTDLEVRSLVRRATDVHREMLLRDKERNILGTYIAAGEQELAEIRANLSRDEQRDYDLRRQLTTAQQTLDELTREQIALLSQSPEVEAVTSLPTPLAETVTGREIHLRLASGYVAIIPLEELLREFKAHAEQNVWRMRDQNMLSDTIGPLDGFRLRYRLAKQQFTARSRSGLEQQGEVVRLVRWELLPDTEQLGEPVEHALSSSANLKRRLQKSSPEATTVTIWTYPESFGDFRKLKKALFDLGYTTAARPLPNGILIGGSPHGSKSAAQ